jgi:hypothetical protein
MRPGQVTSDNQAFAQVLVRLESEVGQIIRLIGEAKQRGLFHGTAPFWALIRMMFPIAESLGDLIHRQGQPVLNLESVLKNEFETVRPGYSRIAATLAVLYRHSLTHQDELRMLLTDGKEIDWYVGFGHREIHLSVSKPEPRVIIIHFDTTAFYDDLVAVCKGAIGKHGDGQVAIRYNSWLQLDLDGPPSNGTKKRAVAEIAAL